MPIEQTLDNTLGAAYVGNLFAVFLYGLTTLQTYTYYNRSEKDARLLKFLVAVLWVFDTLHTVLICHAVYTYAVANFGNLAALQIPTWSVVAQMLVAGVSDIVCRAVFCYRIYILSNQHRLLLAVNGLGIIVMVASNLSLSVICFEISLFSDLDKISWLFYFNLSAAVVFDGVIAASMYWLLGKSTSPLMRINSTVSTLVMYSVSTGLVTTVCTIATLILRVVAPQTFLFKAVYFILSKLLLNALLASLNARQALREQLLNANMITLPTLSLTGPDSDFSERGRYINTIQFAAPSTTSAMDSKEVSTSF